MWNLLVVLAEEQTPGPGGAFSNLLPLFMIIMIVFYFTVMRPMRRQDQERNALLKGMKKNDDVVTTSGIYGTVVAISDKEDEITVRVADNVRLRMTKGSIARNLTNEAAAKAQKAGKDAVTREPPPATGKSTGIKQG
jgi:preprotein translocase subunit YajC